MEETRINHFLKELAYLSKKYNLYIEGCGCCESPYIRDIKTHDRICLRIEYDMEKKQYTGNINR